VGSSQNGLEKASEGDVADVTRWVGLVVGEVEVPHPEGELGGVPVGEVAGVEGKPRRDGDHAERGGDRRRPPGLQALKQEEAAGKLPAACLN